MVQELLEQVARGNCVVLLGTDVGEPGGIAAFVAALADECNYPADNPDRDCSLPAVARYYQAMMGGPERGRHALVSRLRDWLDRDGRNDQPTALHRAIAGLPVKRIVDLGYDRGLETALRAASRRCDVVVRDHELPYAAHSGVLLVKLCGTADQPESLVLTEDEYAEFASQSDRSHPLLMDQLRVWTATRVLLWVGVDPRDSHWQRLHRAMAEGISLNRRREYALAQTESAGAAWAECDVTAVPTPDPAAWLVDLARAVDALPQQPVDQVLEPGKLLGRRPYKFLDFYSAADADLFFGREGRADELAARILAEPLVVLFGRSGVGKTSLLLAGVVPRLARRDCWPVYARPGEDPIVALRAAAEANLSPADRTALAGIADLGAFFEAAAERVGKIPVVVLDQAEECFTALAPPVRERWVTALARSLQGTSGNMRWVLSLREEFAAELHEWSTQVPGLFDHTARLMALSRDGAREAIAGPLDIVGGKIDPHLVERVLDDLLGEREVDELTQEGVPPAPLQIVCDRLYQARDATKRVTLAAYETLGGARRILTEYVDLALAQLPRAQREIAVALLKALVTERETKLPLRSEEILDHVEGDRAEKQAVLAGLVEARLVRSLEVGGTRRYELMHEVLVEKIRSWMDEPERAAQAARDLLRQEHTARKELQVQVLPEREKVAYIHQQRENPYLYLDREDVELMLQAALREGLAPGYWVRRAAEMGVSPWPILAPLLESAEEQARIHALWGLTGWDAPQAWDALRAGMGDASPRVRVAAHQALYHLGTDQALALLDGSDDLRLVLAGEFTMGSERNDDEKPVHPVTLEAFFAEKYPVTNARYARFVEAGGYESEQWWTRAGWHWVWRVGQARPSFWDGEKWNQPDYPVVGVTWYETWAYARWAGRRLLTEAEWEKAARGTDERTYPWGNEFGLDRCNTRESKFQRTSPVGRYGPAGDSPYGCADMAGNVWEWTSSLYWPYPYRADDGREDPEVQSTRVLRGWAWSNYGVNARCASRFHRTPVFINNNVGCRCGVVCVSNHS